MLSNKTIVVTGAASGIGAATAKTLKSDGATIIGVDRNPPTGSVDRYVAVDLTDPASIDRCVDEIGTGIDALCSVAGVPPTQGRTAVLKVNFLGLKHLTLGMIPRLADGASIVNMSSLAGIGWPEAITAIKVFLSEVSFDTVEGFCEENNINAVRAYFFAKELLNVWTMQNRWTWRDRGIRMNSVSPGPVDTPILADFMESLGERAEEDVGIMDRLGVPEDIAPLVAFLCSDASQWIRGTNIPCDGGLSARHIAHASGLE